MEKSPLDLFTDFCTKKNWYQQNKEAVVFYPTSPDQRLTDAFWDCLGETSYRPSNQVFIELYIQTTRWDLIINGPSLDNEEEPELYARFELQNEKLKTTGLYSQDEARWINGRGYPKKKNLISSLSPGENKSLLMNKIYVLTNNRSEEYKCIRTKDNPRNTLQKLLQAFSIIADNLDEGIYDTYNEKQYNFGDAGEAAIMLGETFTGKFSKLRKQVPLDPVDN